MKEPVTGLSLLDSALFHAILGELGGLCCHTQLRGA